MNKSPSETPPPTIPDLSVSTDGAAAPEPEAMDNQAAAVNQDLTIGKEKGALAAAGQVKTVDLMVSGLSGSSALASNRLFSGRLHRRIGHGRSRTPVSSADFIHTVETVQLQ